MKHTRRLFLLGFNELLMNCFNMLDMRSMNNIWVEAVRGSGKLEMLKTFLIFKLKYREMSKNWKVFLRQLVF